MSVIVKGLADTVRRAKAGIVRAGESAQGLNDSAENLNTVVDKVDAMKVELDGAAAELQGALGGLTNGGPPLADLKDAVSSFATADVSALAGGPVGSVPAAIVKVNAANK
jgi:ABC-type transporter Mla subunit MlaD